MCRRASTRFTPRAVAGTLLGLAVLLSGCASGSPERPAVFSFTRQRDDVELSNSSIAGRVARINDVAKRAAGLTQIEAARHVRSLAAVLAADSATPIKVAAVRCLGELPSPDAVAVLGDALRDSDAEVRTEACEALGRIDSPESLQLLAETLTREQHVDAKLEAVRGLGRFRDPRAVQALRSALDDPDPAVQYVAMQSLEQATGIDLGEDVRRWREFTEHPVEALAGRDTNPGRL
jgi:HEAT repeat protein